MAESDVKMGIVKWFNSMTKRGFDPPSKSTAFEAWEVAAVEEAEVTDLIEADAGTTAQAEETMTAEADTVVEAVDMVGDMEAAAVVAVISLGTVDFFSQLVE
ncbi:nucleobase-ascorbate transporter 1 [Phtheirospermum japonicum]|uniref:Nucleobase-ascorbate transporter 1 n=1 Tax=Phtheirospermum japonicum TaxID=374723 RepID=A0A830DGV0_9LAMI|nr:nucleobase-ascorbate transporter 1 [Phtheirospermum japonicum]